MIKIILNRTDIRLVMKSKVFINCIWVIKHILICLIWDSRDILPNINNFLSEL